MSDAELEEEEDVESGMTDSFRFFLQGIMAGKVLSQDETDALYAKSIQAFHDANLGPAPNLNEALQVINGNLEPLFLSIKSLPDERTGETFYSLTNQRGDVDSQKATHYTLHFIELYKKIIQAIVEATGTESAKKEQGVRYSDGTISWDDAVHMMESSKATKQHTEIFLNEMNAEKWLEIIEKPKKRLTLGVRSLLELKQWLEDRYEGIVVDCIICSEHVIRGQICQNDKCSVKMHHHCSKRWFSTRKNECPTCKNEWKSKQP
eukprot:TRINITY_DN13154_c0_g1_i1.p1 TRINITY_DN13154_c0_g1~~TRINITY_DN13154_c0_g1_i1.p1  ORF type:complete len:263 (-),score=78.76 TRINITY_DN13154_c0_g1_i1:163-951(-)